MHIASIVHRYNRIRELGIRNSSKSLYHKVAQKLFQVTWEHKAKNQKAQHSWKQVARNHGFNKSFEQYWSQAVKKHLPHIQVPEGLLSNAHQYVDNIFDILGSGPQKLLPIPWHTDFRLAKNNPSAHSTFEKYIFYKNIRITNDQTSMGKDIKVPWELSRFQHAPILGFVYNQTFNELYTKTCVQQITDWIEHNPYLLGINWLCPMEVGIRAINWIWAWNYIKKSEHIPVAFWERFTCSLYDHMHYLEHNWEIFDTKTSNHYLSDLLGYLYLCWFFQDLPGIKQKKDWCVQELIRECNKQVFDEGSDYEGSTSYHQLVTEIIDHVLFLSSHMNIPMPPDMHKKRERMHEFIAWCSINEKDTIRIGDNDSGSILAMKLYNYTKHPQAENTRVKTYKDFGVSIIKSSDWHVSLRHEVYKKHQPSGHFHNDALSITLAIEGNPIIIDPGSFVYTASTKWRNYFRSAKVHNTLFIKDHEPIPFDERLFALAMQEKSLIADITCNKETIHIAAQSCAYKRLNIAPHRSLIWSQNSLTVQDHWQGNISQFTRKWNFLLDPTIKADGNNNTWILSRNNKDLLMLQSTIPFCKTEAYMSPHYGIKIPTLSLQGEHTGLPLKRYDMVFTKL
jgi:hypothetical protein